MRQWLTRVIRWSLALVVCGLALGVPAHAKGYPMTLTVSPDVLLDGQAVRVHIAGISDTQTHYVLRAGRAGDTPLCAGAMLIPRAPAFAGQVTDQNKPPLLQADVSFPWPASLGPGTYVLCALTQSGGHLVAISPEVRVLSATEPSALADPSLSLSGGEVVRVTVRNVPTDPSQLTASLRNMNTGNMTGLVTYNLIIGPEPGVTSFDIVLPEHMSVGDYQVIVWAGHVALTSNTLSLRSPASLQPTPVPHPSPVAAAQVDVGTLSLVGAIVAALTLLIAGLVVLPSLRVRRPRDPDLSYSQLDSQHGQP
ncbi:MAG TPA: hypothetical protein VF807_00385 [Ktedonobacterales bacterium]